jgi:hypothetical protein
VVGEGGSVGSGIEWMDGVGVFADADDFLGVRCTERGTEARSSSGAGWEAEVFDRSLDVCERLGAST